MRLTPMVAAGKAGRMFEKVGTEGATMKLDDLSPASRKVSHISGAGWGDCLKKVR